ncbi:hypothetical protein LZ31DRAFT_391698 [Colletotrichum somersetense]|nr:hypothetical protein LZ31DRAFT_391698 [Colletotrichum somersetense]
MEPQISAAPARRLKAISPYPYTTYTIRTYTQTRTRSNHDSHILLQRTLRGGEAPSPLAFPPALALSPVLISGRHNYPYPSPLPPLPNSLPGFGLISCWAELSQGTLTLRRRLWFSDRTHTHTHTLSLSLSLSLSLPLSLSLSLSPPAGYQPETRFAKKKSRCNKISSGPSRVIQQQRTWQPREPSETHRPPVSVSDVPKITRAHSGNLAACYRVSCLSHHLPTLGSLYYYRPFPSEP